MRADLRHIPALTPLLKRLWPEHPAGELEKVLADYISGGESAAF